MIATPFALNCAKAISRLHPAAFLQDVRKWRQHYVKACFTFSILKLVPTLSDRYGWLAQIFKIFDDRFEYVLFDLILLPNVDSTRKFRSISHSSNRGLFSGIPSDSVEYASWHALVHSGEAPPEGPAVAFLRISLRRSDGACLGEKPPSKVQLSARARHVVGEKRE